MKRLLTLGMAAALIACACAARAYPTLAGPTGLVLVPTAFVTCPGEIDLALDYDTGKGSHTYAGTFLFDGAPDVGYANFHSKSSWPFRVTYGVAQSFEIGAAYDFDAVYGKGVWDVNAKYELPVNWWNSAFALGALYGESGHLVANYYDTAIPPNLINTDSHQIDTTAVYLNGTKNFCLSSLPIGVTLGVEWAEVNFINNNSGWRGQIGADASISKQLDIVADYQTRSRADFQDLWSAGLRYYNFTPGLSAEVAVTNGPFIGTKSTGWLIGLNYALSTGCANTTTTTTPGGYGY